MKDSSLVDSWKVPLILDTLKLAQLLAPFEQAGQHGACFRSHGVYSWQPPYGYLHKSGVHFLGVLQSDPYHWGSILRPLLFGSSTLYIHITKMLQFHPPNPNKDPATYSPHGNAGHMTCLVLPGLCL